MNLASCQEGNAARANLRDLGSALSLPSSAPAEKQAEFGGKASAGGTYLPTVSEPDLGEKKVAYPLDDEGRSFSCHLFPRWTT